MGYGQPTSVVMSSKESDSLSLSNHRLPVVPLPRKRLCLCWDCDWLDPVQAVTAAVYASAVPRPDVSIHSFPAHQALFHNAPRALPLLTLSLRSIISLCINLLQNQAASSRVGSNTNQ